MMQCPLAVIGDVHGEASRLANILTKLRGRRLVFVGDYINRGSNSRQVIGQLIEIQENQRGAVFLLGNHEESLLAYLEGDLPFYKIAAMGGLATIKSYLPMATRCVREELLEVFPQSHRHFLETCSDYFEDSEIVVSHCGINPKSPASRAKTDMVSGSHSELFSNDLISSKLVICGHYAQASRRPYFKHNLICLDTGCGTEGGLLTAVLLPERTFIQA
jgi:serine/threonine protein phosphatase 1